MAVDEMYISNVGPASAATTVKHKEEYSKRRELDERLHILTELRNHSEPFTSTDTPVGLTVQHRERLSGL